MTPLPRYSGHATRWSSSTRRKPGGPARSVESHSPWASAVATKAIVMRAMNSCMEGTRRSLIWSERNRSARAPVPIASCSTCSPAEPGRSGWGS